MKKITMHLPWGRNTNNPKKIVLHAMGEIIDDDSKVKHKRYHFAVDYLDILRISAHALICPSGLIVRCRADNERAWHARGHNTDSLGIEFLVGGAHDHTSLLRAIKRPYLTNAQARAGHFVISEWCSKFNLTSADIYTHSELSPTRKHDPGFTWQQLQEMIRVKENHEQN